MLRILREKWLAGVLFYPRHLHHHATSPSPPLNESRLMKVMMRVMSDGSIEEAVDIPDTEFNFFTVEIERLLFTVIWELHILIQVKNYYVSVRGDLKKARLLNGLNKIQNGIPLIKANFFYRVSE